MNDEVIDPGFFQQRGLFLERIQKQLLPLREKHHARMRKKSEQHSLAIDAPGAFTKAIDDLLVAEMNAVEGSGGDDRIADRAEFVDVVVDFHEG
jgi:hypothetical protein